MILKDIINQSCYAANGYIESTDSIDLLERYILFNLPVLQQFKHMVVVNTYKQYDEILVNLNYELWNKYFKNIDFIDLKINRGHSFGIADSEIALLKYCKSLDFKWICKSSNDVIFEEDILNKPIELADFYYMNGIGYGGMLKYNFDLEQIIEKDFYPQTNFYFLDISKIDYIYHEEYIETTYDYIKNIPDYNNKIWEYIEGWSCENFLQKCINRNRLSKFHLISKEKYITLLEVVKNYEIHDSSHKNIMIEGICHLQFPYKETIEI